MLAVGLAVRLAPDAAIWCCFVTHTGIACFAAAFACLDAGKRGAAAACGGDVPGLAAARTAAGLSRPVFWTGIKTLKAPGTTPLATALVAGLSACRVQASRFADACLPVAGLAGLEAALDACDLAFASLAVLAAVGRATTASGLPARRLLLPGRPLACGAAGCSTLAAGCLTTAAGTLVDVALAAGDALTAGARGSCCCEGFACDRRQEQCSLESSND